MKPAAMLLLLVGVVLPVGASDVELSISQRADGVESTVILNMVLINDDPGAVYNSATLDLNAMLGVVADTVIALNPAYVNRQEGITSYPAPVPVLRMVGPVGLKVTGMEALAVTGGMELALSVETVGGRLLVDTVTVEHATTPQGPWSAVGAISGDGMSYNGTVTAPAGGTGFVRVRGP